MATRVNGQGAPISLAWVIMNKNTMIVIMLKIVSLILLISQISDSPMLYSLSKASGSLCPPKLKHLEKQFCVLKSLQHFQRISRNVLATHQTAQRIPLLKDY